MATFVKTLGMIGPDANTAAKVIANAWTTAEFTQKLIGNYHLKRREKSECKSSKTIRIHQQFPSQSAFEVLGRSVKVFPGLLLAVEDIS